MNLTDIITSPKLIANGHGAWTGSLGELIAWETNRWEGPALGMIQAGRLTQAEWEAEDFDLATYAGRMTLEDVRNLADDPNAEVTEAGATITLAQLAREWDADPYAVATYLDLPEDAEEGDELGKFGFTDADLAELAKNPLD